MYLCQWTHPNCLSNHQLPAHEWQAGYTLMGIQAHLADAQHEQFKMILQHICKNPVSEGTVSIKPKAVPVFSGQSVLELSFALLP